MKAMKVRVEGHVQGVGFRWWVNWQASQLGLAGHAKNLPDDSVEVVAQGEPRAVDTLVRLLGEQPSSARRPGRVTWITATPVEPDGGHVRFEML